MTEAKFFASLFAMFAAGCGNSGNTSDARDLCESLVASASSPEENSLASLCLRLTDRGHEALDRAEKAFEADHRCEPCAETLAELLAANRNAAGAVCPSGSGLMLSRPW